MTRCAQGLVALAAVVLAASAWPSEARAGDAAKPRLLPLRVSSNKLPAEDIARLTEGVLAKLARYPFEVLRVPDADPMDLMVDAGCADFDADCLAAIGVGRNADLVLYTEVSDQKGRYQVQMRLVDVQTKEVKAPEGGTEDADKLAEFVSRGLERVFGAEPAKEPELVRIDVNSTPAGGEAYVDKDFVGLTPVTVRLKPGPYTLRVAKVGYKEAVQSLTVEERKARTLALALNPVEVPNMPLTPTPAKEREAKAAPWYEAWWFWTIVGAAVVGGATTAGVLLTKDKGTSGSVGFSPSASFAPKDATLYPR
jgi:hypothetical protein